MKILVMGGSYFLGKSFLELACGSHEITIFNRGNRPLTVDGITQIVGDRKSPEDLQKLSDGEFEAVIDFCAYDEGDIEAVLRQVENTCRQYVFISTIDVYEHGAGKLLDESAAFETKDFGGDIGKYILGKVALEKELVKSAGERGIHYTSIRPAMIYGPGNYAPREGMYFHWIKQAGQIIHPLDATGQFQLVYVKDVARAILGALGNEAAFDNGFNLAPGWMESYDSFANTLDACFTKPIERVGLTVEEIAERQIPLPFPLTGFESNWYSGSKALQLIETYTDLTTGMLETIQAEWE